MSQSYPGLPKTVGGFVRKFISATIRHIVLGAFYGLPALVIAIGFSFYLSEVPSYTGGYVLIALLSIILGIVSDSIDPTDHSIDLEGQIDDDGTEIDQSQVYTLVTILNVMTVSWVTGLTIVSGGFAAMVQYVFGIGYISAIVAAGFPFFERKVGEHYPTFSINRWAAEFGLVVCHVYLSFINGSNDGIDEEIERSARDSGPIL